MLVIKNVITSIFFVLLILFFVFNKIQAITPEKKHKIMILCKDDNIYNETSALLLKIPNLVVAEKQKADKLLKKIKFTHTSIVGNLKEIQKADIDTILLLKDKKGFINGSLYRIRDRKKIWTEFKKTEQMLVAIKNKFETIIVLQDIVTLQSKEGIDVSLTLEKSAYKFGEKFIFYVSSAEDGYLYVIYIQQDGEIVILFPNDYQKDNKIKTGEDITLPGHEEVNFKFSPPAGLEMLKVFVTKKPLNITGKSTESRGPFEAVAGGKKNQFVLNLISKLNELKKTNWGEANREIQVMEQ
jgi:hypothetical protein